MGDVAQQANQTPTRRILGCDEGWPRRLGRYELIEPIGSGGMATVFLAKLSGPLGFEKHVALKVMRPSLSMDPKMREMFFHEARVTSDLCHPNIVQVLELEEDDGQYFIVMERLRGATFSRILEASEPGQSPLCDPRIACHVAMDACDALHHVHEAKGPLGTPLDLVHLDVSPQNLLVTDLGYVKLIDFGISRSAAHDSDSDEGSPSGKLAYISPEQAAGEAPDRRSDVFSLGVVLWELLTGRRLFAGENPYESLYRVSHAPIPPISLLAPNVPKSIEEVIQKALARDPVERHQTALELYQDLKHAVRPLGPPPTRKELAALLDEVPEVPDAAEDLLTPRQAA